MPSITALALATWLAAAIPVPVPPDAAAPAQVASHYLDAVEAGDLDAAGSLFAADAVVFESGGVEGAWEEYRAHHLGAEIDAIERFEIRRCTAPTVDASDDGTLAAVAWPIEYTIELEDGRTIESRGTVTFVLELRDGDHRIAQLHWSSRKQDGETPPAGAATVDPSDGVSQDEAVAIAREEHDFLLCSVEVEEAEVDGRAAWKVILRGQPPQPGHPVGEYGEVYVEKATGRVLSVTRT